MVSTLRSSLLSGMVIGASCFAYPVLAHEDMDRLAELAHMFDQRSIVSPPKQVPCTLSGGTETTCFSITVTPLPVEHITGPWCPQSVEDSSDKGGIWLDGGTKYDVDGAFVKNLATFYKDPEWQLYDVETGKVRITSTEEACAAAARPDVDAKYQNYCVECQPSYIPKGRTVTYVLPIHPQDTFFTHRVAFAGIGVAFNGVKFEAPAPTDAILAAHTLAPFDDCGGHVNLHAGYHYHAVTGCNKEVASSSGHAPVIGIAMDGYQIHGRLNADGNEPDDLDGCRGHEIEGLPYHYHVNAPGKNQILGCFKAETGCSSEDPDSICDATKRPEPPPG